jgi:hypothetical protein
MTPLQATGALSPDPSSIAESGLGEYAMALAAAGVRGRRGRPERGREEGADFDAMFHLTPASAMFGRIAGRDGVRAALSWRDEAFGED